MRPALYPRESSAATEKPGASAAPTGNATWMPIHAANDSLEFAAKIARARRDARLDPEQAAMLLRAWMSDHG